MSYNLQRVKYTLFKYRVQNSEMNKHPPTIKKIPHVPCLPTPASGNQWSHFCPKSFFCLFYNVIQMESFSMYSLMQYMQPSESGYFSGSLLEKERGRSFPLNSSLHTSITEESILHETKSRRADLIRIKIIKDQNVHSNKKILILFCFIGIYLTYFCFYNIQVLWIMNFWGNKIFKEDSHNQFYS